jgi:hypothetical protein
MTKHTPATPLPFTLRSHEVSKPGGDGTYHVNATYTILKDGAPLGFTEHCAAVARLNAYPKLVEKSRALYDSLQGRLNTLIQHTATPGEKEAYRKAREDFRALLRELGEE